MNPRVFYSFDYSCQQPHRNHDIITWTAEAEQERLLELFEQDPFFSSLAEHDRTEALLFLQNALTFSSATDANCHVEIYDNAKLVQVKISQTSFMLHDRATQSLHAMNQIASININVENTTDIVFSFALVYLHTQFILK